MPEVRLKYAKYVEEQCKRCSPRLYAVTLGSCVTALRRNAIDSGCDIHSSAFLCAFWSPAMTSVYCFMRCVMLAAQQLRT